MRVTSAPVIYPTNHVSRKNTVITIASRLVSRTLNLDILTITAHFTQRQVRRLNQDEEIGRVPIVVEKEKGVFSRYPKKQLAHGVSQTEEEYAYGRRYTKIGS